MSGASEQLLKAERRSHRRLFQVQHFISWLQVVNKEETVGFPRRLLVQLAELLLRQQGAQLLHHSVQLVLVAQPPAAEELHVHPHARDKRKPPPSKTGAGDARDRPKPPPSETGAGDACERPKPLPSETGAVDARHVDMRKRPRARLARWTLVTCGNLTALKRDRS